MTRTGELIPYAIACVTIGAPLLFTLTVYALFGKQLRRRKKRQIRRVLDSEE